MKDAKQFFSDFANSESLRSGILEEMNRLRDGGEDQEIWQGRRDTFCFLAVLGLPCFCVGFL